MSDLQRCLQGAAVGYATHPILWWIPAPVWMLLVACTATQESDDGRFDAGDNGASIGILQFNDVRAYVGLGLVADDDDWRRDPYSSGVAAARYVAEGLASESRWWLALVRDPLTTFRAMWVFGIDPANYDAWQRDGGARFQAEGERKGRERWAEWSAYAFALSVGSALAAIGAAGNAWRTR